MSFRSLLAASTASLAALVAFSAACSAGSPADKTIEKTSPDATAMASSTPSAAPSAAAIPGPIEVMAPAPRDTATPKDGASSFGSSCKDEQCEDGLTCVHYSGIAGPAVDLSSCEIKCSKRSTCPSGFTCTTIADGPRGVCRPKH